MCENELWCPECGLREGNLDSEDRHNRSIIALSKYMLLLQSYSLDSLSTPFHSVYQKRFIYRGFSEQQKLVLFGELMGFRSGRSYFIFHFLTQTTQILGVIR